MTEKEREWFGALLEKERAIAEKEQEWFDALRDVESGLRNKNTDFIESPDRKQDEGARHDPS